MRQTVLLLLVERTALAHCHLWSFRGEGIDWLIQWVPDRLWRSGWKEKVASMDDQSSSRDAVHHWANVVKWCFCCHSSRCRVAFLLCLLQQIVCPLERARLQRRRQQPSYLPMHSHSSPLHSPGLALLLAQQHLESMEPPRSGSSQSITR